MRGAAAVLAGLILYGSVAAAAPASRRVTLLASWLDSVRGHEPGRDDPPAHAVGAWPDGDISALWLDLQTVIRFVRCANCGPTKVLHLGSDSRFAVVSYTNAELRALRAMATEIRLRGDRGYDLLKRGAILHA